MLNEHVLNDKINAKKCVGSHYQYIHPVKRGKVTIPNHGGDLTKAVVQSVLKKAGLK